MERFEARVIPIASISSSTIKSELCLTILNEDVILEIFSYLQLSDLLMVDEAIYTWRHLTRKLLSKRKMVSIECNPYVYQHDSIAQKWLNDKNLTEWKLLLKLCPNLSQLDLGKLEYLYAEQILKIFELISRLCMNLERIDFDYEPNFSNDLSYEDVVKIDMSKDEYIFPWIPSWGHVDEKEIILTPKSLEPKDMGNNYAFDYVKSILAKVKPYIRDPYWFSMTFQQRHLRHVTTNETTVVARLQTITLGTCSRQDSGFLIVRQLQMLRSDAASVQSEKCDEKKAITKYVENICSLFRQLRELPRLSRELFNLEHFKDKQNVSVTSETRKSCFGCRCCLCWCGPRDVSADCGYCSSQLAWTDWNTHWKTGHKSNWNGDWSKYENCNDRHCGRRERDDRKQKSRNETTADRKKERATADSDDWKYDRDKTDERKSTRHYRDEKQFGRSDNDDRKTKGRHGRK